MPATYDAGHHIFEFLLLVSDGCRGGWRQPGGYSLSERGRNREPAFGGVALRWRGEREEEALL